MASRPQAMKAVAHAGDFPAHTFFGANPRSSSIPDLDQLLDAVDLVTVSVGV